MRRQLVLTIDNRLEGFEAYLKNNITDFKNQREILLDRTDISSFSFVRNINGVDARVTNVALMKDGKFWQQIVNRVPV